MRRLSWQEIEDRYGGLIRDAASRNMLDPAVLGGLIMQESGGNPSARSHAGAYGLTQIMPATAKCYGYDLSTPKGQIAAGADYLARCLKHRNVNGNLEKALAAYNGGWGNVGKWTRRAAEAQKEGNQRTWMDYAFKETREYVPRVLKYADQYRGHLARALKPVTTSLAAGSDENTQTPTFLPAEDPPAAKKRRMSRYHPSRK